jgi:hypothetical protein
VIQKVRQRYDFVSQKLAENKIPNGPQLADFVRKLVADIWAVAPGHTKQLLRPGFQSIGWNPDSNRASSEVPPTAQQVVGFLAKALEKLNPSAPPPPVPEKTILAIMEEKVVFVRTRLAEGKIPSPPQMADFLRKLVVVAGPAAKRSSSPGDFQLVQNGFSSIGWDMISNRATAPSAPSPTALLNFLERLVGFLGGAAPAYTPAPAPAPAPVRLQPGNAAPPMQPTTTAAGVKIFPNAGFNMDDYTTKLNKDTLSQEQIAFAERIAREIEGEKQGKKKSQGWDEGDSTMVSWE